MFDLVLGNCLYNSLHSVDSFDTVGTVSLLHVFLEAVQMSAHGEWEIHDCFFKRFVLFQYYLKGSYSICELCEKKLKYYRIYTAAMGWIMSTVS